MAPSNILISHKYAKVIMVVYHPIFKKITPSSEGKVMALETKGENSLHMK